MIKFKANIKSMEVQLPIGIYLKSTGEWYDTCVVEAMDGDAEEQISEKKIRNNGAKMITRLLANKIKKVGDKEYPNGIGETIARNMYADDRDTCLIAIRSLMSDEMEMHVTCPSCGYKEDVYISLSSILEENGKWGDDEDYHDPGLDRGIVEFELPDGIIVENTETKEETLCKKGMLKLPDGNIEENIAQSATNNPGKANSLLLSACILEIEGIRKIDQYVIKAMSRVDREYVASVIENAKPGPKFIVEHVCSNCDNDYKFSLSLPYFFTSGINQID